MAGTAERREGHVERRLWLSLFGPAVAWIAAQQLSFYLSPWVCSTGRRWVLLLITGSSLAAAGAGALAAWTIWRALESEKPPPSRESGRRRFMAAGGLLLAVFFVVAILALAIPQAVHRPCD
jgi:MFS family permease